MKTVMVVDDVPANVDVVLGFLYEAGYRVLVADSGFRGIEQLELEAPDLILLDLMMPGMDGIETCRRIKIRDAWKHIPIIMMTAADELFKKLAAARSISLPSLSSRRKCWLGCKPICTFANSKRSSNR